MKKQKPTVERLREVLRYEAGTGKLYWIKKPSYRANRAVVGEEAGRTSTNNYNDIQIDGRRMKAHHIVWALHTGEFPALFIDHINGNKTENRVDNLRLATASDNAANRVSEMGSTSIYLGVSFKSANRAWVAQIHKSGKKIHLGLFDSEATAAKAYNNAAMKHHGKFARLNVVE